MDNGTCSIEGCGRVELLRRGWCNKHYIRWRLNGDPLALKPTPHARRPAAPRPVCRIEGCDETVKVLKHGLCSAHYHRWWKSGDPNPVDTSVTTRLEAQVDRSGGPDSCHLWQGRPDISGYGRIRNGGNARPAHIIAWELATGQQIPPGWEVDHECHNQAVRDGDCKPGMCAHRLCCNPRHLIPRPREEHQGPAVTMRPVGSAAPNAKLTEADVAQIRDALAAGARQVDIAARFRVGQRAISQIKTGKTWSHLLTVSPAT